MVLSEISEHPLYLPDMSPSDFNLFPKFKEPLLCRRFHGILSARHAVGRSVADISNQHLANRLQRFPSIRQKSQDDFHELLMDDVLSDNGINL
ncbi:hypothetical protein TNCV_3215741 [Trichonephila clavipes]|nr:hypothetical protein TNCV_3215741 [Trichonephila clavipes]